MVHKRSFLDRIEDIWKKIVDGTISCVLDNSPNDYDLAHYLGRSVETEYVVINHWSYKFNTVNDK